MPYVRRTKRRKSLTRRSRITAVVCAVLAISLAIVGLGLIQQERLQATGEAAAQYNETVASSGLESAGPVALFIGDSYAHGTGASSEDARWTTLVAQEMGWVEENQAAGGTGYLATAGPEGCGKAFCPNYRGQLETDIAEAGPDIVVIAGGQNDFYTYPDDGGEAIRSSVLATYSAYRAAFPDAQLVAVGPSTIGDPQGAAETTADEAVRESASSVDATYVNLLSPNVVEPEMITPDGGHVDDEGHRAIAERVLSALRQKP